MEHARCSWTRRYRICTRWGYPGLLPGHDGIPLNSALWSVYEKMDIPRGNIESTGGVALAWRKNLNNWTSYSDLQNSLSWKALRRATSSAPPQPKTKKAKGTKITKPYIPAKQLQCPVQSSIIQVPTIPVCYPGKGYGMYDFHLLRGSSWSFYGERFISFI